MRVQGSPIISKRIVQILAGINILLAIIGFSLDIVLIPEMVDFLVIMWFVLSIAYNVLGALVLSRDPRHPVGWLFLLVGFLSTLGWLQVFTLLFDFSRGLYELGERMREIAFIPVVVIPISLVLQFFPDGHLPTKRWWPITAAVLVGILGQAAYFAFSPWVPGPGGSPIQNPFGLEGQEQVFNFINQASQVFALIGVVGSLVMVIGRFWKAEGIQRVQMKWLVSTVILGIPILVISSFTPLAFYLLFLLPILMAVAMSLAILRYHLFDIDLIIRRTLQYAMLTGLLALIYFGSVVLLQSLAGQFSSDQSPAVTVISTLAIVVLFNPLRTRIQEFIDKRFYRQKYDAERALSEFAATARDEVELDNLTKALVKVVETTVNPERLSLWLKEDGDF